MGSHTIKEHLASYKQEPPSHILLWTHTMCIRIYVRVNVFWWRWYGGGYSQIIWHRINNNSRAEEHTATQHNCVCLYVVVGKKVDWMGAPQA